MLMCVVAGVELAVVHILFGHFEGADPIAAPLVNPPKVKYGGIGSVDPMVVPMVVLMVIPMVFLMVAAMAVLSKLKYERSSNLLTVVGGYETWRE